MGSLNPNEFIEIEKLHIFNHVDVDQKENVERSNRVGKLEGINLENSHSQCKLRY